MVQVEGYAYPRLGRVAASALLTIATLHMPLLLAAIALVNDPPVTPPVVARLFFTWTVAPWVVARLIARTVTATIQVTDDRLVIERPGRRIEVPRNAIRELRAWRFPLPCLGATVHLRSGARLPIDLASPALTPLLRALAPASSSITWTAAWAEARSTWIRAWWEHPAIKFGLFAVVPAAVLFNAHQWIAYGGTFGEWYLMGPASWFRTLGVYTATVMIYLILWAGTWRIGAEAVAWAAGHLLAGRETARRAAQARRAVETCGRIAYYAGVPALLALRFAP